MPIECRKALNSGNGTETRNAVEIAGLMPSRKVLNPGNETETFYLG